jgi:hypothetical protein
MKVSTENDNNFGYEKIPIVVDNIPLNCLSIKISSELFADLSEAKSIFIYLYAGSPDAAAWMLKFVFVYLANTAVLCYSLTII